ncbi:MAG: carbamoyl-phosphate synthase large subunit [Nitrospiraceae bacterium]|nr:carbamoyl-phosphate synthase large subunit [Nitrospiraceae bacterium]
MPKRTDIKKILIIGAGPIVIGQACEFDYSGVQACKALKEEGYEIVLVNSNPATIMTDPGMAHRTYIEPITPAVVEKIIDRERPDALLPTMGGQTALNTAVALAELGVLDKYQVELIGAKLPAIKKAEDRELFKKAMLSIGLEVPKSGFATTMENAYEILEHVGFPAILRPAFTLGGTGGGIAYNREEYTELIMRGLDASPVHQVLIEESVVGWKEYELEVMRDAKDNVVIVCSIENLDPMGIHTGDSITVAPAQTLTDKEYQIMRDASLRIIREIGVDTGGSNIQFAVNPVNGRMIVIEMNPRVSRSSALASKATGFPIAKFAAKLAVGYTLDEILNDITKATPACFEPTIDYVVTKYPRFAFEKFPQADATLTTQMKSVGEAMAIGRTFKESLQKALRSLEIDRYGFESRRERDGDAEAGLADIRQKISVPNWERLWYVADGFRAGMTIEDIFGLSKIDPWFLHQIQQIITMEADLKKRGASVLSDGNATLDHPLRKAKEYGFSDRRIARLLTTTEDAVRAARKSLGIMPAFKTVDTCAAEFVAKTPYLYSTYEKPFIRIQGPGSGVQERQGQGKIECEANPTDRKKVVILGGGPNRIGQGIEFDYCCVHASFALKEDDYETIMVNCNPETVSTDYDTSDRLYFEPLTLEDVLHIIEREKPMGVIVQFGGQTPLKLAVPLEKAGVKILGTTPDSIDRAEDRKRFKDLLDKLGLRQAESGTAVSCDEAVDAANRIGYPVMVRPSYVLGGRAMEIVYDEASIRDYMSRAVKASPDRPVLVDRYLEDAVEIDVDAISDGKEVVVAGIMEHIEEAGVHSGDSACSLPPFSLPKDTVEEIRRQARELALELGVVGLMNVQFAVKDGLVYVLEVNPRASRTVPFVSKAIGVPLAKLASRVMAGRTLAELGFTKEVTISHVAVKEAVFPFAKFPGVDTLLGPEMKSTGEVMGIDTDFGMSFAKSQIAAGNPMPTSGRVFISVKDKDKQAAFEVASGLERAGFKLVATRGTAEYLRKRGVTVETVNKVFEGRPHIVDSIKDRQVDLVINTVHGAESQKDSYSIRRTTLTQGIPYFTTMSAAKAAVRGIVALKAKPLQVKSIQEYQNV